MTIATTNSAVVLQGNGSTTVWPYNFLIPNANQVQVIVTNTSTGAATIVPPTAYSITGIGNAGGGTVTYPLSGTPLASGYSIAITRNLPAQQLSSLENQNGFYPQTIEAALDYVTMLCQQINSALSALPNAPIGVGLSPAAQALLASFAGASQIGYQQVGSAAISRTLQAKISELVSASDYPNIQAAISAAGTTGAVSIPATYAGTDTYTNPHNILILDYRSNGQPGSFGTWSVIQPAWGYSLFPFGNDLVMRTHASADKYLESTKVACTTTTSLVAGANVNVPISAVTLGNNRIGTIQTGTSSMISLSGGLVIGRETANEEYLSPGSYSIVDGTHLSLTCANTHTGTTDIEQIGSTILISRDFQIWSHDIQPAQTSGVFNPPLRIIDLHGNIFAKIPSDSIGAFPYSAWQFGCILTGTRGPNFNLMFQNYTTTSQFQILNSAGQLAFSMNDTGQVELYKGGLSVDGAANSSGSTGAIQVGRNSFTAVPSSTTDAFLEWMGNSVTNLNPSNTAGSLLISSRQTTNAEVVIATYNTGASALRPVVRLNTNGVWAGTDNAFSMGGASNRWSVVYAATGSINTSDANQKTNIRAPNAAEIAVARTLKSQMFMYQFKSAVEKKGATAARLHAGTTAQAVQAAFIAQGLNPDDYGVFCSDTWHTYNGEWLPPDMVDVNGNYTLITYNLNGETVQPDENGNYPEGAVEVRTPVPTESVTQLGIRYDELWAFIIAGL